MLLACVSEVCYGYMVRITSQLEFDHTVDAGSSSPTVVNGSQVLTVGHSARSSASGGGASASDIGADAVAIPSKPPGSPSLASSAASDDGSDAAESYLNRLTLADDIREASADVSNDALPITHNSLIRQQRPFRPQPDDYLGLPSLIMVHSGAADSSKRCVACSLRIGAVGQRLSPHVHSVLLRIPL